MQCFKEKLPDYEFYFCLQMPGGFNNDKGDIINCQTQPNKIDIPFVVSIGKTAFPSKYMLFQICESLL